MQPEQLIRSRNESSPRPGASLEYHHAFKDLKLNETLLTVKNYLAVYNEIQSVGMKMMHQKML